MPDPPGLVVKKGTKRLELFERPGPSSSTWISSSPAVPRLHPSATAPPVSIRAHLEVRPGHGDGTPGLQPGHSPREGSHGHRGQVRRGEAGQLGVGLHEAAEGRRALPDDADPALGVLLPVVGPGLAAEQGLQAVRDGADRGQRVVQLVAQHTDEAFPGQALFRAQRSADIGEDEELVG
jgi:hypothetical protein